MGLRIFNTLSGAKEPLQPLDPPKVGLYVCGPTVYDLSHVGHARVYVAFDVVARVLRARGYQLTYVRNYTDVDDKIIRRAKERGQKPQELSEHFIAEYRHDMQSLNVLPADVEPKVTDHIPEIVSLIGRLIEREMAYAAQGDVYFAVRRFPGYGKLSHRDVDDLRSGARVEPGEQKRDPLDFALWKAAKPGEPSWPSPWGPGRPGWHIECSAMSERYLGPSFELHAGGKDLVFPHHENEIAQSEGASGLPLAQIWMHNGFVNLDQEKMSKSLGNIFTIRDLTSRYEPEALRLFLLGTHYRSPIQFSEEGVAEAQRRLDYFYGSLAKADALLGGLAAPLPEAPSEWLPLVDVALDDDFNTPEVLGILASPFSQLNEGCDRAAKGGKDRSQTLETVARLRGSLRRSGALLGLFGQEARAYQERRRRQLAAERNLDVGLVERLIAERNQCRQAKDFAQADALRQRLLAMGVEIMDRQGETEWKLLT